MVLYNSSQKRFEIYKKKEIQKLKMLLAGESIANIPADDNDEGDEEEEA